jgi:hypothetical protein
VCHLCQRLDQSTKGLRMFEVESSQDATTKIQVKRHENKNADSSAKTQTHC